MDWAEELKMSIRKTTARKGRRSKSRDLLKDITSSAQTSQSLTSNSTNNVSQTTSSNNNDLFIDITLPATSSVATTSNNADIAISGLAAASVLHLSTTSTPTDSKKPPSLRRISGGWADTSLGKLSKSKKSSVDDDRFVLKSSSNTSPTYDIPIIPDLDDFKDDLLLNEVAEPPSYVLNLAYIRMSRVIFRFPIFRVSVDRVVTFKELNSDILAQKSYTNVEDVDLSILTKCLQAPENLDEADEVWEWEKLFTEVVAEIHADKPMPLKPEKKNLILKPDELPPPSVMLS
uniref:Intraflagellar transport protein 43 homolog n=1 Tax=Glossina brevipalpis TaxID=37001 RepID=A0A1A9WZS6_9MUSC